jgi:aryl-alcohol dehydrogenase
LVELYRQGKFLFDKLIKFYPFEEINRAAEDSEEGVTLKPVLHIG